jgi:hypothetical protein
MASQFRERLSEPSGYSEHPVPGSGPFDSRRHASSDPATASYWPTVPAGTFDASKIDITSAEGDPGSTTIWVAKDGRKVVKTAATLPQMGGAVVTLQLQKQPSWPWFPEGPLAGQAAGGPHEGKAISQMALTSAAG